MRINLEFFAVSAVWPENPSIVVSAFIVLLTTLAAAFVVTRIRPRLPACLIAWLVPVASAVTIEFLCADSPPGFRMVALILGVLFGMKGVVTIQARRNEQEILPPLAWFAFAAGWLGMRPSLFANVPGRARSGAASYLREGVVGLLFGLAFAWAAAWISKSEQLISHESIRLLLVALLALPALSLMLHFGAINLLVGLWRLAGADCRPLFRQPLRSKSLTEFWSRRWNLAFSEMTAVTLFRPLKKRWGKGPALFASFLFSGLLHELAISLPVHAGYGMPMLYFLIQAIAIGCEEHLDKLGKPIDAVPWKGHVWSVAWLVLPLPLLFHSPFLRGIVLPLVGVEPGVF